MAERKARRKKVAPGKREIPAEKAGSIPEVFDSNRYDSMSEMRESATMGSSGARDVLSQAKRQDRMSPEFTKAKAEPKHSSGVSPTLDERAETLRREQERAKNDKSLRGYRSA